MKRKFLALFLTAALALPVTACGNEDSSSTSAQGNAPVEADAEAPAGQEEEQKEEDAKETEAENTDAAETQEQVEDPMAAALENMNSVTSMEMQMLMEMDMTVEADGQKEIVESITTMDMVTFTDPLKIKMDMTMDMGAEGSVSMSIYADADESGAYTMYMYDGAEWQAAPMSGLEIAEYDARSSMVGTIGEASLYTEEGTEKVNGANAYKYSYVMTGDEMKEALLSSGALNSLSSIGLTTSDVYDMLDGLGEVYTYVWVDEETLYPVKYEMDMTDVMDALMGVIVEAMGEQAEGITMHVPKLTMTMTCSNYNNAEDFTIPEEAKAAVAMAE